MPNYKKEINPMKQIMIMLFLLLTLTLLPESPANAKNFNHYNDWLKKDLFPKLSGYFDTPFLKEIIINAR